MNPIQPNIAHLFNAAPISASPKNSAGLTSGFANILTESLEAAVQTEHMDKASTLELLMGENDDLSGLLIDMQKAELSLQLALQIRNKVVDAYNEVMRMSV
jgi:flagellar hook-basal body complex protein FliE